MSDDQARLDKERDQWRELLDGVRKHKKQVRQYIKMLEANPFLVGADGWVMLAPVDGMPMGPEGQVADDGRGLTVGAFNLSYPQVEAMIGLTLMSLMKGEQVDICNIKERKDKYDD